MTYILLKFTLSLSLNEIYQFSIAIYAIHNSFAVVIVCCILLWEFIYSLKNVNFLRTVKFV